MRTRTLILFVVAVMLAGGTAALVRSWLAQHAVEASATPAPPPAMPQKSILVAHAAIARGQKLKPADLAWQPWPETGLDPAYIQQGTKSIEAVSGRVVREPFARGEPITEAKTVEPGNGGVLAAVLRPGMRAVSVPVDNNSDVSGFIFPGDQVDVVVTETLPVAGGGNGSAGPRRVAETALQNVRVIAVDQKLDNKNGEAAVAKNATLEVTPKQSEIIALAAQMGKLSLSLRSLEPARPQIALDSHDDPAPGSFTLDSEVSQFLAKPFTERDNLDADSVTILRGNGKSG